MELTQEIAHELLYYDEKTGVFKWRITRGHFAKAGYVAGTIQSKGYRQIWIAGKRYLAHRLAWFMKNGCWPRQHIDHINGEKDDNRIDNLRECSPLENQQNMSKRNRACSSKHIGVCFNKPTGKWTANICSNNKQIYLGMFDTEDEAAFAYNEAKKQHHTFNPIVRKT